MRSLKFILLGSLSFFLMGFPLKGEEKNSELFFIRPLGMGGAFTAVADDHNIFFFNPAGMVLRTGTEITILEVAAGISEDTLDVIEFINDNEDDLTNFNNLPFSKQVALLKEIEEDISTLDPRVFASYDAASFVSGPRFLGLPFHVGFAVLGTVDTKFELKASGGVPLINVDVSNDIIIPLTIAKRFDAPYFFPGRFGIGVTGKAMQRNRIKQDKISLLKLDDIDLPPVSQGRGFGADLGFLYQPTNNINLGVMIQDIGGTRLSFDKVDPEKGWPGQPKRDSVIAPKTNIGVAVVPRKILWIFPTNERLTLAADVRDVLDKDKHIFFEDGFKKPLGENFFTQFHIGAEYRWWIARLRAGAFQGYPSFGLGLDLPLIKLDVALFSREIGPRAGDRRQEHIAASLAFKFGTGKVEARERIVKAKKVRKQKKSGVEAEPESDLPESDEADVVTEEDDALGDEAEKKDEAGEKGEAEPKEEHNKKESKEKSSDKLEMKSEDEDEIPE